MLTPLLFSPEGVYLTTDADASSGLEQCGKIYQALDEQYDRGMIYLIVLKNMSTIALSPKRLVKFKSGYEFRAVDGYANVHPEFCLPIWDKHQADIAVNDLFFAVVSGPCMLTTQTPADAGNVFSVMDWLTNATAAASTGTTAGRARVSDFTGATDVLRKQIDFARARALSAATTNNTNADRLAYVGKLF